MSTRSAATAWEALFRAQVAMMRRFEAERDFDPLSAREYDVLFNLAGAQGRALRLGVLNGQLLISQPSLSRMVDRLAAAGLVERRGTPGDARGVLVALTPHGAEVQKRIGRTHVRTIADLVDPALSPDEQQMLAALCEKLRAAVGQDRHLAAAQGAR